MARAKTDSAKKRAKKTDDAQAASVKSANRTAANREVLNRVLRGAQNCGDITLFQDLPGRQLLRLKALMHPVIFPADTVVLAVERPVEAIYILVEGTVKIYLERANGTETILALLGAGEVLGEVSGVDGKVPSANVRTLEECCFLAIDRADLCKCMQTMPIFSCNVARILARRLRLATVQIQSFAALDVYGRVSRQLLAFAQEYGHETPHGVRIPMRLKQGDLADLIGASRVRVNHVLMHYKRSGAISLDPNHRITIHDRAALSERCHALL